MDTEEALDQMKESMKKIVKSTNSVLKHSMIAFKKTKQKLLFLDNIPMIPSEETKLWFGKRQIEKITIPDFFDLLFKEASHNNNLDFGSRTISFSDEDALIFGFQSHTKIPIIDIFENLPKYFQ